MQNWIALTVYEFAVMCFS